MSNNATGKISFLLASLVLLQLNVSPTTAAEKYVKCFTCFDVASPRSCRQLVTCGKGDICFTREFTDSRGLQSFHLGCENEARCHIFLNAPLVGKRDVPNTDPAPPEKCYDCCSGDECNGRLCQGGGGAHVLPTYHYPSTTATPFCTCPQITCPTSTPHTLPSAVCLNTTACPEHYIQHKDRCYLFATWPLSWDEARAHCKTQGADLVSINSQEEQEDLVKLLNILDAKSISDIQIGGVYSLAPKEWQWVDRSPVQYTNWHPGYPGALPHSSGHHIGLFNPPYNSDYKTGPWVVLTSNIVPFICEKPVSK